MWGKSHIWAFIRASITQQCFSERAWVLSRSLYTRQPVFGCQENAVLHLSWTGCSGGWWRGDKWRVGLQLLLLLLCVEILYTIRATLHPLFVCEELGQKDKQKGWSVLLFEEELGALAVDERGKWEENQRAFHSLFIIILCGNFSGMFVRRNWVRTQECMDP